MATSHPTEGSTVLPTMSSSTNDDSRATAEDGHLSSPGQGLSLPLLGTSRPSTAPKAEELAPSVPCATAGVLPALASTAGMPLLPSRQGPADTETLATAEIGAQRPTPAPSSATIRLDDDVADAAVVALAPIGISDAAVDPSSAVTARLQPSATLSSSTCAAATSDATIDRASKTPPCAPTTQATQLQVLDAVPAGPALPTDISDDNAGMGKQGSHSGSGSKSQEVGAPVAIPPPSQAPNLGAAAPRPVHVPAPAVGSVHAHATATAHPLARGLPPMQRGSSCGGSSSTNNALLMTLGDHPGRQARKRIEAILKKEARQSDLLVIAQRRVHARRNHNGYLDLLQRDDIALEQWADTCTLRHVRVEAAVHIQARFRSRPFTAEARLSSYVDLSRWRARLRQQLMDIQELRDDVRSQAFEFFEQVAPPMYKRVKELRKRLSEARGRATRDAAAAEERVGDTRSEKTNTDARSGKARSEARAGRANTDAHSGESSNDARAADMQGSNEGSPRDSASPRRWRGALAAQAAVMAVAAVVNPSSRSGVVMSTKHPAFAIVREAQEDLLRTLSKLKALESRMLAFAARGDIKLLKAKDDPFGEPGVISRQLIRQQRVAQTPGSPKWNVMTARLKQAEKRQLLISTLVPGRKSTKNALEELKALREEMDAVDEAAHALRRIQQQLLQLQGGRCVAEVDEEAAPSSKLAAISNEDRVKVSVLGALAGSGHSLVAGSNGALMRRSGDQRGKGGLFAKRLPAGFSMMHDAVRLQPVASPLWVCSPSAGWHAHYAVGAPKACRFPLPSSSPSSQLLSHADADGSDLFSPGIAEVGGGIERQRAVNDHPLTDAYAKKLPWRAPPQAERSFTPAARSIATPSATARSPRRKAMRPTRSLPALLSKTYGPHSKQS